ncbi:TIGR02587 family membrane protein [Leeuwenhoekiella sp. A2]|uniref:TIGR02587 family membrane protein n=1 Tax=Leeuwenhoekiella sp. A2 TaxID=3141460 RepID=UPI003A803C5F
MTDSIIPVSDSLKEYARGITGGLLFSLPMLYTMELWWAGFISSPLRLLIYFFVGILLLLAYNHYVGIRSSHTLLEGIAETIEEMGMGLLLTAAVLWLSGRITTDMSFSEINGKIIVEAVTVAIGISVGKTQLGTSDDDDDQEVEKREPHIQRELGIALCGAILIASNVAPTEEIAVIALEIENYKLLLIAFVSIIIGGIILYYSNFKGSKQWVRKPNSQTDVLAGTVIMYAIALTSSAFMLWFFGRFNGLSLHGIIAESIVLGFPAALGASAGRLLIQS